MNNLSQECIEQIEKVSQISLNPKSYQSGCKEALTNPTIYQSAGLIKAQDILPETFKTEAVNTILVNALRYLNDEQTSHLLKAICQRKKDAALEAGLMTVEETLRFVDSLRDYTSENHSILGHDDRTTTELLNIFRNQNQEK